MKELSEKLLNVENELDKINNYLSSTPEPGEALEDLDELINQHIELVITKEELEKQMDEKAKHLLDKYLEESVYAQCYDGVCLKMSDIAEVYGVRTSPQFVLEIFDEAKKLVDETLQSTQPHFEISNSIAYLRRKHNEAISSSIHSPYSREFLNVKAVLIEMVYLVVLWDLMSDKSDLVIQKLSNARTICENYDDFLKCMHNPLWDLVCERIECNDGRQRGEDFRIECRELEKRVKELEEELEKAQAGWIKEDQDFKATKTKERITVLHSLLNLDIPLVGEEREQFKILCELMVGATDNTLGVYLSQGKLNETRDLYKKIQNDYPILKGHPKP